MKRVLIVITTGLESYGGLATVMLNYYRAMEKSGICIDFASINPLEQDLDNEFKNNDSCYYNLGSRKGKFLQYIKNYSRVLKENKYDVVHINGNSSTMFFELILAKIYGVKKRIAHGHASRSNYPLIHKILLPFFRLSYTDAIAVSKQCGEWLFNKDYSVLNNAIDTSKYGFSYQTRLAFRKKYHIENEFVVGNVGKLNKDKNHIFLLEIFEIIKRQNPNSKLLIVGGGELEEYLKKSVHEKELDGAVIFTGMLNDTSGALQAMDVFVFPSRNEGFGMALVEAQTSGLMCYASDSIPKETRVSKNVKYISLQKKPTEWAEIILKPNEVNRGTISECAKKNIKNSGFDINCEASRLRNIYID